MKIAFDAKRITHNGTGLGNYGRMVVDMLSTYAPENKYLLYTPDPGRDDLRGRVRLCDSVEFKYPAKAHSRLGRNLWRFSGVSKELPRDIDLFHGLTGELPAGLKKEGVRSVVTIHDLIFLRYPSFYKWIDRKIYTYKYRKACQQADRIIAISEATKRDIIRFFHIPEQKIDVVYQGCDKNFKGTVTEESRRALRRKYALPERFLLTVGSIEERKNLLLIVRALALMEEPMHLVVIGKRTPYTARVEQFAAEHGLGDYLHILNRVPFDELPVFYNMAEIFLYPSRFEGFGIPMIEAANCGVPCIGATGSCLEEAGGPDQIYVNPDDPEELAAKIRLLASDPALRVQMALRGKDYVRRFEPEVLYRDYLKVYEKVIGK